VQFVTTFKIWNSYFKIAFIIYSAVWPELYKSGDGCFTVTWISTTLSQQFKLHVGYNCRRQWCHQN